MQFFLFSFFYENAVVLLLGDYVVNLVVLSNYIIFTIIAEKYLTKASQ